MPTKVRDLYRFLTRRIDAFIFPPLCIVCDRPRPENDRWLCTQCHRELTLLITDRNGCPRCGQNRSLRTCTCELAWEFPFSRIRSFVDYNDTVQSIMHQIKYQGKSGLARAIGRLCNNYLNTGDDYTETVVVPIPLHWKRRQKRGFNQAEQFARGLFSGMPAVTLDMNILRRTRNTKTQTKLDRSERSHNLSGAFRLTSAGAAAINGKKVILVDDVITTGATTATAATTLLEGGCREVEVLSFARD